MAIPAPQAGGPAGNPFAAPVVPIARTTLPAVVRVGAALALFAELGLTVAREGGVWLGWFTVDGTRWLGILMVVLQAGAASLLVWRVRTPGRLLVAAVGLAVIATVASAHLGRLQARFVDPLSRASLAGLELSQGVAAGMVLRQGGRTRWALLAGVAVVGTALGSALVTADLGGLRLVVVAMWFGGRLLRYAALARIAAG